MTMKKFNSLSLTIGFCVISVTLPLCAQVNQNNGLDGLWLADGYGMLVEIAGDAIRLFEVTSVSCIPADKGKRLPEDPRADVFLLDDDNGKLQILPGASADEKQILFLGAASTVGLRRAQRRPDICAQTTPDTPEANFEVFWTTFNEQHAFLKERGVDWLATYKKYRPMVNANTPPKELFKILVEMIKPMRDAHTFIRDEKGAQRYSGKRFDSHPLSREEKTQAMTIINTKYIRGERQLYCNKRILYGRLNDRTGYLGIIGFAGYVGGDYEAESQALALALDEIISDSVKLKALVIDVRLNGGGYDPLGVQVASRLSDDKYVAFVKRAKRARNDAKDPSRFTPPQAAWVVPGKSPRFTGRVIELIGIETVSAGETFSMALMGRKPAVTRIGEPTQGVFSDVLVRRLPNGWYFGMPNEVFLTEGGRHFEVTGVPPDIAVPVFSRDDLKMGRDSALNKALALLAEEEKN